MRQLLAYLQSTGYLGIELLNEQRRSSQGLPATGFMLLLHRTEHSHGVVVAGSGPLALCPYLPEYQVLNQECHTLTSTKGS